VFGERRSATLLPALSGTHGTTGAVGNGTVPLEFEERFCAKYIIPSA